MGSTVSVNYEKILEAKTKLGVYGAHLREAEAGLRANEKALEAAEGEAALAYEEFRGELWDLVKKNRDEITEQRNALTGFAEAMHACMPPTNPDATVRVGQESVRSFIDNMWKLVSEAHTIEEIRETDEMYEVFSHYNEDGIAVNVTDWDRINRERANGDVVWHIQNNQILRDSYEACRGIVFRMEDIYDNNVVPFVETDRAWAVQAESLLEKASAVYPGTDAVLGRLKLGEEDYDWAYLGEVMAKPLGEMTNAEYNALIRMLEGLTYPVVKEKELQRFLQTCYINPRIPDGNMEGGFISIRTIAEAGDNEIFTTLSPVFGEMRKRYEARYLPWVGEQGIRSALGLVSPPAWEGNLFNARVFSMQLMDNLWMFCKEGRGWGSAMVDGTYTGYEAPDSYEHNFGCMVDLELVKMHGDEPNADGTEVITYDWKLHAYQGDGLFARRSTEIEMYAFTGPSGTIAKNADATAKELVSVTDGAGGKFVRDVIEAGGGLGLGKFSPVFLIGSLDTWDKDCATATKATNRSNTTQLSRIFNAAGACAAVSLVDGKMATTSFMVYDPEALRKNVDAYNASAWNRGYLTVETVEKYLSFDFSENEPDSGKLPPAMEGFIKFIEDKPRIKEVR